jgi:hypothetical protein
VVDLPWSLVHALPQATLEGRCHRDFTRAQIASQMLAMARQGHGQAGTLKH